MPYLKGNSDQLTCMDGVREKKGEDRKSALFHIQLTLWPEVVSVLLKGREANDNGYPGLGFVSFTQNTEGSFLCDFLTERSVQ